ncbi:MAG: arylsulfatase [Planctomycetaceae bacterium]|nr:arylsulfatase [Planctomycetaceae bacterium]
MPRFLIVLSVLLSLSSALHAERPNLIYILADDLGYGDLSCYGQSTLQTPNLDKMAAEGMRFTRHHAGSTVCAPSRCVLMTGLHTGHCRVRGNGPGQLQADDKTFAEELRKVGYKTGCFGKWGIGNPPPIDDPNRHGFDQFYGYVNMFHAHNYYPEFLIRNGKHEPLRNKLYPDYRDYSTGAKEGAGVAEVAVDYAPHLIADEFFSFVERNKDRNFFAYYALNIPHANNEAGREKRIDKNGLRVPEVIDSAKRRSWPVQEQGFATMIDQIDSDVGRLMALLKKLGIENNTIVMFSSDNGPHQEGGHQMEFFNSNGELRGMKRDLYDGGVKVPFIVWGPGRVPAGQTSDLLSGFQDIFPTMLDLAEVEGGYPQTDGLSLAPTLTGHPERQAKHEHLYWEFFEQGGKQAVVKGHWKGIRLGTLKNPDAPLELYHLKTDPSEENNIADQHPEIVKELATIMQREHVDP